MLGVEVACAPQTDRTHKRNLTGVFQHWDCLDPDWNPGGIWRPVALESTGPIRIQHLRVAVPAGRRRPGPTSRCGPCSTRPRAAAATITTTVGGTDHTQDVTLAGGENQLEWTVAVADPRLWWPQALGDQPLEDVTVEVTAEGARPAEPPPRRCAPGCGRSRMRDWIVSVNGERLFVKGANHGPTRMALAEATPDEVRRDVDLAVDCGLDLLRVHAHVARPELYDAADEAGLLLWQDMPLQWGYARGIRKQAVRQAREAVDLLGHHPSVAIWCGHNEPFALDVGPGADADPGALAGRFALAQELPTWNKTVLDRSVKRAIEKADGSRPVIAHSGVLPHPPTLDGTDSHLYFGWYHGDERDLPDLARRLPRLVRWVGEFGAQAVPDDGRLHRARALARPRLGAARPHPRAAEAALRRARAAGRARDVPRRGRPRRRRTRPTLLKHHVETLRRLKYRPTGGFAQFCFADGHPAVTWSVLDHERVPKAGYEALEAACRPVIVVADRPPATVAPGEALALDVHVVSDLRVPIDAATVAPSCAGPAAPTGGAGRARSAPTSAAGSARCSSSSPTRPARSTSTLTLDAGDHSATNAYAATIAADLSDLTSVSAGSMPSGGPMVEASGPKCST